MRLKPTKQEQALMLEASFLRTELQLAKERIATLESQVETLTKALEAAKREENEACAKEADGWATNPPVAARSGEYVARCIAIGIRERIQ